MTDEEKINGEKQPKKRGRRKGKARRRGSGSVFRRPERKGKQWVAQIILDDGRTRQRYFNTQAEADVALNEMLYEQRKGMLATGPQQTVKQFMEYWLEEVHRPTLRISSYVRYRGILDKDILPELGHLKLQELTIQHVEAFYARKSKEGKSANTIKVIHAVLHMALAHATYLNLLTRNVSEIARKSLPRQKRYEYHTLTREEAQKLLEQVQGHRLEALLILAITTAMRRGELVALRWRDVHLQERYLQVRHSARHVVGYGLQITEPKTEAGRRKIMLTPFLIEVLTQHRSIQEAERRAAGAAWKEHDLVFCGPDGAYLNPNHPLLWLQRLLKKAGLPPMRFHDLRHSAATLLLAMGVHIKVVQELLGHSNITTTLNIYSHVLPSLHQDAMDRLSNLFDQESREDERKDDPGDTHMN
jgi:integrase